MRIFQSYLQLIWQQIDYKKQSIILLRIVLLKCLAKTRMLVFWSFEKRFYQLFQNIRFQRIITVADILLDYFDESQVLQSNCYSLVFTFQMNIKGLIYARYSTSVKIHGVIKQESNKSLVSDVDKLPQKIKALKAKANERDKLKTPYGVWYVTHDDNDIVYALCTSEEYPERHAYGLIQKLQQKIAQINHCQYETQENIKAHTKKLAAQLADKYNDLVKLDKLAQAQEEVQSLKDELGTGIKKIMGNQQSLNTMSDKAQRMKNYANEFEKNSQKLERMLYWRNCKLKVIAVIFIVALLGFVILIIVQTTRSKR